MQTVPFALSIHKFINSIGADVGFASIIAVALLVLLYFAHAREAASLRDRLDETHSRIGGLESRLMQMLGAQAAQRGRGPVPPPPGVAVPPPGVPGVAPAAGVGSAIPSVRRIPTATATSAVMTPAMVGAANGSAPLAPLGVAAPSLASATKVIPSPMPTPAAPALPQPPAPVAATAAPNATVAPPAGQDPTLVSPPAGQDPTVVSAPAANGHGPATAAGGAVAPAPPVPGRRPGQPPAPSAPFSLPPAPSGPPLAPATADTTLAPPAWIGADGPARPRRSRPQTSLLLDDEFGRDLGRLRSSGRLLPLLISAAAVVVIVVALIVISGSGSGSPSTAVVKHTPTTPTGASVANQKKAGGSAAFDAAKVQVSVLNGTAVGGLAGDVAKVLTGDGYKQGNVSNASVQTQTQTAVYYVTGADTAANQKAAQHVASSLSLAPNSVQPAPQSALQSCATGPTGAALQSCTANVIVTVGSDKANLASGNAG